MAPSSTPFVLHANFNASKKLIIEKWPNERDVYDLIWPWRRLAHIGDPSSDLIIVTGLIIGKEVCLAV